MDALTLKGIQNGQVQKMTKFDKRIEELLANTLRGGSKQNMDTVDCNLSTEIH